MQLLGDGINGSRISTHLVDSPPFGRRFGVVARKLRLEYRGAVYHVLNRGDRREPIFQTDRDRALFFDTLAQTSRKLVGKCLPDAQSFRKCDCGSRSPTVIRRLASPFNNAFVP
jgi:hypothetical protein